MCAPLPHTIASMICEGWDEQASMEQHHGFWNPCRGMTDGQQWISA